MHTRRRGARLAVAAAGAAAALAVTATMALATDRSHAGPSATPATPLSPASFARTTHRAQALPEPVEKRLRRLGMGPYRKLFGGLSVGDPGSDLTVYLTRLDPPTEAAFRAAVPQHRLAFRRVANNLTRLNRMMASLEARRDEIVASGTQLHAFGPDVRTGRLDIAVVDLRPGDAHRLAAMFGATNIQVRSITREEADSDVLQ